MKTQLQVCFLSAVVISAIASAPISAKADVNPRLSKIGAEIRGVKNGAAFGLLFGFRYVSYESDSFLIGGAGYTGQLTSGATGSFSYGGLLAGFAGNISSKLDYEFSLLAGGGGGFMGTDASGVGGGIALEPGAAIGLVVGKSVRSSLSAGYVLIPSSGSFSGFTFGLRFDFLMNGDNLDL